MDLLTNRDLLARVEADTLRISSEGFKLEDGDALILKEELIRTNETHLFPSGLGRDFTRNELLPAVFKFFREHARVHGWFYLPSGESVVSSLERLKSTLMMNPAAQDEKNVLTSNQASPWLKSMFKSYWHVQGGPIESFHDDKRFKAVLCYRLGLNTSRMYSYKLADRTVVECHETFDITPADVRFGFIAGRNNVSWFRPITAADIYRRLLPGAQSPVVWDPSSGFGARMLGFSSVFSHGAYHGNEPAGMTAADLGRLVEELSVANPGVKNSVDQVGSEHRVFDEGSVDLVMTSPPYFDKEKYFNEPTQCWCAYPGLFSWNQSYLIPTFKAAFHALKPGCNMVINIDLKHSHIIKQAAREVGFLHDETKDLALPLGRDHFSRKNGHLQLNFEPIHVFTKP